MNLNLNLGAGALDIPIARKLDISGASERSLQAPARPAQAPGPARPGAWFVPGTNQPRQPGGPVQASLGPLRAMHQSFLDRRHDGTTGVRMERWFVVLESAMGRWHYYWPQAAQTTRQAADPALWASPVAWGSRRAA